MVLIGFAIALTSLPALTGISRRWEHAADRYSLKLTSDQAAYATVFRRLGKRHLKCFNSLVWRC